MMTKYGDLACDSCSGYFDGDPLEVVEANQKIPDTIHDPEKVRTLMWFWLCGECRTHYPNGSTDYFVSDYFTEDSLYLCEHCNAYIPEDVREEFDDTEVCLSCSPRIEITV